MPAARARLTVDLDALAANHAWLRQRAAPAEVAPVVKADGYGLGAGPIGRRLWAEGARSFFVARLEEGEALRAALGPDRPARILVLDGAAAGSAPRLVEADLTPVLNSPAQVEGWAAFAVAHGPLPCAIHIDTGMHRLGLAPEELAALVAARASQVADLARGLTMRAQLGVPRKTLLKDAEEAAELALLSRRADAAREG